MNIENMEQEFPKMPQSMRDMIEKEVEKQVKVTPQRGYFSLKKAVVASLAATFVLGTTIFAGTKLYRMSSSPQGNYGMTTKIEKTDATENTEKIEQLFGEYLWNTISIRDTAVAKEKKENFYHGILLGLLGYKANWLIKSNAESGTGYSDILVEVPNNRTGIVIELKYAGNGDLDAACAEALKQMEEKSYVDKLKQDGMRNFIKYGIACFKKDCRVVIAG